jgi:hypothetical protein
MRALQTSFMAPRCLECRYRRDGLPSGAPCPECSAPAPPDEWVVVFGSANEWSAWWPIAAGGAMLTVGITLLIWAWTYGVPAPVLVEGAALSIGGVFIVAWSVPAALRAADGGDIIWIIMPDGLEVRTRLRTRKRPWSELQQVLYEAGWKPNSAQLTVGEPMQPLSESSIWLNTTTCDTRRIQALLRDHIAAAKSVNATGQAVR